MCIFERYTIIVRRKLISVFSNRDRLLLLSVVRPIEYGSEICDCNKSQARAILLGGAKKILGCSSKTLRFVDCQITGTPNSCLVRSGK